jgi:hypothetical protein
MADLVGAANNIVAHHSIETNGGQQQRQQGEESGQRGNKLFVRYEIIDLGRGSL